MVLFECTSTYHQTCPLQPGAGLYPIISGIQKFPHCLALITALNSMLGTARESKLGCFQREEAVRGQAEALYYTSVNVKLPRTDVGLERPPHPSASTHLLPLCPHISGLLRVIIISIKPLSLSDTGHIHPCVDSSIQTNKHSKEYKNMSNTVTYLIQSSKFTCNIA